ncbi:hypothetical protein MINTM019_28520 [Mycobacterium paraintracellulare]|nr:hypothetical protein MINTM019_28520 [Mycobacterium paraintracellulare]
MRTAARLIFPALQPCLRDIHRGIPRPERNVAIAGGRTRRPQPSPPLGAQDADLTFTEEERSRIALLADALIPVTSADAVIAGIREVRADGYALVDGWVLTGEPQSG